MTPDMVSESPFSAASLGKYGAMIDMEQKQKKSTKANIAKVIFWEELKVLMVEGCSRDVVLKSWYTKS